ncbi:hypothetical protein KAS31_02315 [Candidatus Parcubacteria bacterium]|nr:hypothetical protein [Candidatus Parcubacteria bacterium]
MARLHALAVAKHCLDLKCIKYTDEMIEEFVKLLDFDDFKIEDEIYFMKFKEETLEEYLKSFNGAITCYYTESIYTKREMVKDLMNLRNNSLSHVYLIFAAIRIKAAIEKKAISWEEIKETKESIDNYVLKAKNKT